MGLFLVPDAIKTPANHHHLSYCIFHASKKFTYLLLAEQKRSLLCWPCTFFFFFGNLQCCSSAARLKTQVYDCVGFYCIPVQKLRDVHIYRGRCYSSGKTLQNNTWQSLADLHLHQKKIKKSFCGMFMAKNLWNFSLFICGFSAVFYSLKIILYTSLSYIFIFVPLIMSKWSRLCHKSHVTLVTEPEAGSLV